LEPLPRDKRKDERIAARVRCWCESRDVTFYARVSNLSEGGLFLRTSTPLPIGARAQVRFGDETCDVETQVTVVWTRHADRDGHASGMGLRFESVDERTLEQIRRVVLGQKKAYRAED
jgi:uncharacterized protein (TIGR02266 family)